MGRTPVEALADLNAETMRAQMDAIERLALEIVGRTT